MISIFQHSTFIKSLASVTSGALVTLAFAPYNQIWLVFVCFSIALYCFHQATPKKAMWFAWLFGLGLQCSGVGWIYYSMHVHGGGSVLFSSLVIILLAAYLAIYTALFAYTINRFCHSSPALRLMLFYPASFAVFEWLQGFVLTGFAWMQLGYTQIDLPLSGYAPLLGNHAVSALVVMTSGFMVYVFDKKLNTMSTIKKSIVSVVVIWIIGFGLKQVNWTQVDGDEIKVSLIQGNIKQEQKWVRSNRVPTIKLYRDMTLKNLDSDLIIWPETAIPDYKHRSVGFLDTLRDQVQGSNTDVLLGIFIKNLETGRYYNSVIDLNENVYAKRHLVPLGEFVPLRFLIEYFNKWMNVPMSDIDFGDDTQPLMTAAGYPASISICFEDAFARDIRRDLPEARLLINVSNDAWFEDSREPHQHHEIARMRALETGRYMLRATNTGVTSIIGPHGENLAVAPQFVTTTLTGKVKPMRGMTPYILWGDWALLLVCLTVIGVGIHRSKLIRSKSTRSENNSVN